MIERPASPPSVTATRRGRAGTAPTRFDFRRPYRYASGVQRADVVLGALVAIVSVASGCADKPSVYCDDRDPPSCYEVDLGRSQIAILWPNSDKRLDLPLTVESEGLYTFPNPLGEDRGRVEVRIVDAETISVKNERDEGDPMIHKRRK